MTTADALRLACTACRVRYVVMTAVARAECPRCGSELVARPRRARARRAQPVASRWDGALDAVFGAVADLRQLATTTARVLARGFFAAFGASILLAAAALALQSAARAALPADAVGAATLGALRFISLVAIASAQVVAFASAASPAHRIVGPLEAITCALHRLPRLAFFSAALALAAAALVALPSVARLGSLPVALGAIAFAIVYIRVGVLAPILAIVDDLSVARSAVGAARLSRRGPLVLAAAAGGGVLLQIAGAGSLSVAVIEPALGARMALVGLAAVLGFGMPALQASAWSVLAARRAR